MSANYPIHRWLLSGSLILLLMYFGRTVLVPLSFALLISFIIYPFCSRLERRGLPRSISITLGVLLVLLFLAGVIFLLGWQFSQFLAEWPAIRIKLLAALDDIKNFLVTDFGISAEEQVNYLQTLLRDQSYQVVPVVRNMLYFSATGFIMMILIPFYTALILYYRHLWMKALVRFFGSDKKERIYQLLGGAVDTYYNFIKGMLLVYLIVGILNSVGLAILGVPHPILFGTIASILTFIPYVGISIGSLLPMAVAWVTFDSFWYPLGVLAIFAFIQYLEANIIFPLAVSANIKVNTLVSIVAIFAGAVIWGAAGMILFIPFLGILKLIADRTEGMEALAIALGDDKPEH